eukprot:Unigene3733_Nuclearia_a/m.11397 Unigene3733_Nuclearia_a/g.11397  ORF Unigene3733_Nuclearia_a/g.11397 Unigene3733_Nuclearia_a/m.11397 type:complete len:439 (-) Unigene3733_Nuclearia_a:989-2305(-)
MLAWSSNSSLCELSGVSGSTAPPACGFHANSCTGSVDVNRNSSVFMTRSHVTSDSLFKLFLIIDTKHVRPMRAIVSSSCKMHVTSSFIIDSSTNVSSPNSNVKRSTSERSATMSVVEIHSVWSILPASRALTARAFCGVRSSKMCSSTPRKITSQNVCDSDVPCSRSVSNRLEHASVRISSSHDIVTSNRPYRIGNQNCRSLSPDFFTSAISCSLSRSISTAGCTTTTSSSAAAPSLSSASDVCALVTPIANSFWCDDIVAMTGSICTRMSMASSPSFGKLMFLANSTSVLTYSANEPCVTTSAKWLSNTARTDSYAMLAISSALSCAPIRSTLMTTRQPDLMLLARANTICWMHRTISSFTLTSATLRNTCANGARKSFWNWKCASSPFSRNFIDSCRSESIAKYATSVVPLQPTLLNRSPRIAQICDHSMRMRFML